MEEKVDLNLDVYSIKDDERICKNSKCCCKKRCFCPILVYLAFLYQILLFINYIRVEVLVFKELEYTEETYKDFPDVV